MKNVTVLLLFIALLATLPAMVHAQRPAQRQAEQALVMSDVSALEPAGRTAPRLAPAVSTVELEQALAAVEERKLHPYFQRVLAKKRLQDVQPMGAQSLARQVAGQPGRSVTRAGKLRFSAIVYTSNATAVAGSGMHVNSRYADFVTVHTTIEQLARLTERAAVSYIAPGAIGHATNNRGVVATGATLLHDGYLGNIPYKGEGAIVCVYDSGIDFTHEDFIEASGNTRILALWDQTLTAQADESPPAGFNYGVEYTQAEINDEIDGSPTNYVREKDNTGHGTHVAGTAAGDGSAYHGIYKGMAPQASLVIVKGGNGDFSFANMIDGLTYCDKKAEAAGMPVVVNLSVGGHSGPHDGTSAIEAAIDAFGSTGAPSQQGRAVTVSAGNEGGSRIHISGTVPANGTDTLRFTVPAGYTPNPGAENDIFSFDGWLEDSTAVSLTAISPPIYDTDGDMAPDSSVTVTVGPGNDANAPSDTTGMIYLSNTTQATLGGGDRELFFQVFDFNASNPPLAGTWKLVYENSTPNPVAYDGWLYENRIGTDNRIVTLESGDVQLTVSMPATSEEALTTGAWTTRVVWPSFNGNTYSFDSRATRGDIVSFSSRGPTRDGRTKPEISAPGQAVVSALSKDASAMDPSIAPGQKHAAKQGTSMATPYVAGAAALLLAEFPNMTARDLKSLLEQTATQDSFTGTMFNNTWGAGKLDVFRAMVTEMGGSLAQRDRYAYAGATSYFVELAGDDKFALQFTPQESGIFSGFEVDVVWQRSDGDPGVSGSGDLLYQLYTDNGSGLPGRALTDTLRKDFVEIVPSTVNYFSMLGATPDSIRVLANQNYHIVFYTEVPQDTLQLYASDTRIGAAVRSAVYDGSQWQESDTFYDNTLAFRVTPIVTRSGGVPVLPVELVAFNATFDDGGVLLRWHTASEKNNVGFGVEHAVAEGAFEEVAFVEGAGTSTAPHRYHVRLEDLDPGLHRFRLRQVGLDGAATYSRIVEVFAGVVGPYELTPVYPNPFNTSARFELSVAEEQEVRIGVYDMLGRRVRVLHSGALKPDEVYVFHLDVGELSSGMYFIRIRGEEFSTMTRAVLVQ